MKQLIRMLSLIMAMSLLAVEAQTEDNVLNIYSWPDFIAPDVIAAFEQQFGVKVNYDAYDNPESMLAKLQSGTTEYDVVFSESYLLPLLIQTGVLAELNPRQIPNRANIDPRFLNQPFDPENRYSLPYIAAILGLLYRTGAIAEPVESWSVAFDPQYAGRIVVWDSMRETITPTLKYLGYAANSVKPEELHAAQALLIKQKQLVKIYVAYSWSQFEFLLTSGEADLIYNVTSGTMSYLNQKTGGKPLFKFAIPKEGTSINVNSMCIPKQAAHPELAHQFINFLHDPQINAQNNNYHLELAVNTAAWPYLDPVVRETTETILNSEQFAVAESLQDLGEGLQLWDDVWSEIKAQ